MIDEFEVAYARFNAEKTFTTLVPSAFEQTVIGGMRVTRDQNRPDAYYNRILGFTPESAADLSAAISWIEDGTTSDQTIRIDTGTGSLAAQTELLRRGFEVADELVWLGADPVHPTPEPQRAASTRLLTPQDRPALRQLRRHEWDIPDAHWHAKKVHLCTDTFTWFGTFVGTELVSAASTWLYGDCAIFGSAFTLPNHRGQGHQQQLLAERRRQTPGQHFVDVAPGSTSYRNCVRAGFSQLDYRQVWTRCDTEG